MSDSPKRDSERTREKLVDAATEIVRTEGLAALGVNAVARRAGVSKVLIYRYFGSLDGLLRAAVERLDLTKTGAIDLSPLETASSTELAPALASGFRTLHDALAADEFTLQLIADELQPSAAANDRVARPLTELLAEVREEQGVTVTRRIAAAMANIADAEPDRIDMEALFAVASASISYLTLRARTVSIYNGVQIGTSAGWDRICGTLARLVELAVTGR